MRLSPPALSRFSFVALALGCAAVSALYPAALGTERPSTAKPNIIVILTDDQGFADYSAAGTKELRTPNIDRIFHEGMSFKNFRTNSCVCSPTRAALMTGRNSDRAGVPGVIRQDPAGSWGYLAEGIPLLPQVLKSAGYKSALIGKWHLGLTAPNLPNLRGFDFFHGFLDDMMNDYWTHLRAGKDSMRLNDQPVETKGTHATDLFTNWACDYLETQAKTPAEPFLLMLTYNAPHAPIQPPSEWLEKVKAREPQLTDARAKLVALIEHLDSGIGRVLETLDRTQLGANTLIFFTSDNGGELDDGAFNGPWRSGKRHLYDGGLRVPFAVRWLGHIAPGTTTETPAQTMDIFATACEVAGVAPPANIDAISQLATLCGQPAPGSDDREFYFVFREGNGRRANVVGAQPEEALIRGDWKIVQDNQYGPRELFNLRQDPQEKNDLATSEPKMYAEMSVRLMKQIQRGGRVPWQAPETP